MGGTTALTYSLATRVDLLAMARLLTHFLDDPLLRPWTPSALQGALADPEQNLCVARAGHTLVGIAAMRYGQRHAELTLLAVAPLWPSYSAPAGPAQGFGFGVKDRLGGV